VILRSCEPLYTPSFPPMTWPHLFIVWLDCTILLENIRHWQKRKHWEIKKYPYQFITVTQTAAFCAAYRCDQLTQTDRHIDHATSDNRPYLLLRLCEAYPLTFCGVCWHCWTAPSLRAVSTRANCWANWVFLASLSSELIKPCTVHLTSHAPVESI